jgi:hypothetical protein
MLFLFGCESRNVICRAGIAACELVRECGVEVNSTSCSEECGGMDPELYESREDVCDEQLWVRARRAVNRLSCEEYRERDLRLPAEWGAAEESCYVSE